MSRHSGSQEVVKNLQNALKAFLADHRKSAEVDPAWRQATENASTGETENEPGCGCDDCLVAGQLLGRIY